MTIAPEILKHYPDLNEAQRQAIAHQEGPLLVIAGPGSGKTYSIVLRALNLLLLGKAEPSQMVLCTFTEKAAFEMRDRMAAAARRVGFECDLSWLRVTTIHGLCNRFIAKHRHHAPLGNNYETLDELTQLLFIFEHFDQIVGAPENGCFLQRWKTKWSAIEGVRNYFDKIAEELVEIDQLVGAVDPFLRSIGRCHGRSGPLCGSEP
jgi:DNA helicase-2/ATP-dependent DNA helicase PcrA